MLSSDLNSHGINHQEAYFLGVGLFLDFYPTLRSKVS